METSGGKDFLQSSLQRLSIRHGVEGMKVEPVATASYVMADHKAESRVEPEARL